MGAFAIQMESEKSDRRSLRAGILSKQDIFPVSGKGTKLTMLMVGTRSSQKGFMVKGRLINHLHRSHKRGRSEVSISNKARYHEQHKNQPPHNNPPTGS